MHHQSPQLQWFQECHKDAVATVGGKNASLGELINAGIPVPPGFAVTTTAFNRFLEEGGIAREIPRLLGKLDAEHQQELDVVSAEVRSLIENAPLPADISECIREAYSGLCETCGMAVVPVAVRSSATAEDLPGASFAGQQDTFLWILGPEEVLQHLRRCFSSLYTSRAIAYRLRMGFAEQAVSISVGVQKMVNADSAGVVFTINPVTGDRSMVSINANFGFGESVVSGEVTPDEFLVDKVSMDIVRRSISKKEVFYTVAPSGRNSELQQVPPGKQTQPSLGDEEIVELVTLAKRIEKHYGRPMDIEWAVDRDMPPGENVLILQARPETVWSSKKVKPKMPKATSALEQIVGNMLAGHKL